MKLNINELITNGRQEFNTEYGSVVVLVWDKGTMSTMKGSEVIKTSPAYLLAFESKKDGNTYYVSTTARYIKEENLASNLEKQLDNIAIKAN